ncbi:MAG: UbiA-like polyprenyltransferase [Planctomycetota bacterium]
MSSVEAAALPVRDTLRLVAFSHSVFALPFALISAWVAAGGMPDLWTLSGIVVCAVAARTAAMAFNRLVDRELDAANPRTAERELPRGALSPAAVRALVLVSSGVFVGAAFALNVLAGYLSPLVLAVVLGYSYTKRFTSMAHLVLGLALGLAPLGAWIAVRGDFEGDLSIPLVLAAAVLTWVAGFDLIYACQDADFDRGRGLHSIPARYGVGRALQASSALHVVTAVLLALFAARAGLGVGYGAALALAVCLLVWQHRIVSPSDLSRVDRAFFTLNGWVGVSLFVGVLIDMHLLASSAPGMGGS